MYYIPKLESPVCLPPIPTPPFLLWITSHLICDSSPYNTN